MMLERNSPRVTVARGEGDAGGYVVTRSPYHPAGPAWEWHVTMRRARRAARRLLREGVAGAWEAQGRSYCGVAAASVA